MRYNNILQSQRATPDHIMFNATLAGHHLRADYNNSRGGSRAASRFDINEVGRCQVRTELS